MPNIGASTKPILFGDLQSAYALRTDGMPSVVKLQERFADQLLVGFMGYARVSGTSIFMASAPAPVAALQIAAS
jgi:HK97 family phage major capsid protein